MNIPSTCKHPIIALVATKTQSKIGNEDIISEASRFLQEHVEKNNRVLLYTDIFELPAISDTIEERDIKSLTMLKHLLANLGTYFNEKRGVFVPLNWEDYSMF